MNKVDIIDAMLAAGMTPQDLFDLAQTRQEEKEQEEKLFQARSEFIDALVFYVYVIRPDLDIDGETVQSIEDALIEQEKEIRSIKKPAAKEKASEDDIIKEFLKTLGF